MSRLIFSKDWSETSLGSPELWPTVLKSTLRIVLNSETPMFIFWGDDLLCFYNDAYRPSLGKNGKHPRILGEKGSEAWEEIWDTIKPWLNETLNGESVHKEDVLVGIYRNGRMEDVYWTFTYNPIYNETGKIEGVLVICQETTEKVLALKKDEKSRKNLENYFAFSPAAIAIVTGPEFIYISANPLYQQLFRQSEEKLIGNSIRKVWNTKKMQELYDLLEQVYISGEKGSVNELSMTSIKGNGSISKFYNFVAQPFKADQDDVPDIMIHAIDVTEQVISRQKIEESDARIRNLLEQSPVAMTLMWGSSLIIEVANKKALELLGRKAEEIISLPTLEALPELKEQGFGKIFDSIFKTGETFIANEFPVTLVRNGTSEELFINFIYEPLKNATGEIEGIVGIGIDVTEQVNARKKLEKNEQELKRFKHMVENATEPFILMREDGSFAYLNKIALQRWGYSSEEAKQLRVPDVDPLHNDEAFKEIFKKAQKEHLPQFETLHKHKDGSVFPVEINMGGLVLENKPYLFAIARDIKERKRSENALKTARDKSERVKRLYEAITSSTLDLIYVFNLKSKFIYANQALLEMWGETWDNAIGKGLLELGYEPWHAEMHEREIQTVIETKAPIRGEVSFPHAELGKRIYDYIFVPVLNVKGNVEAIAGTTRDITELKLIEESLKESNERFRKLAEAMPQLVWTTDADGMADYFNTNWYEYTGSTPEQNLGEEWVSFLHPEDKEETFKAWTQSVESKEPYSIEYRLKGKDENFRWFLARGIPHYDKSGKILTWFGTSTDIEDQKKALQQKDEFLSIASHELKTPITSLKGSLQLASLMIKEENTSEAPRFLKTAETQVDKLTGLVRDLLDISQIRAGKLAVNFIEFDFLEVIKYCVQQETYRSKKHEIVTDFDLQKMIIEADQARMEQVILNLLSNAIKYSPEANKIKVEATIENNFLTFSVTDYGIGIPKEKQSFIFDRFYRAEEAVHQFQGLGLGLYISHEIINQHNGKMWVESKEGKGSTFSFKIPFKQNLSTKK